MKNLNFGVILGVLLGGFPFFGWGMEGQKKPLKKIIRFSENLIGEGIVCAQKKSSSRKLPFVAAEELLWTHGKFLEGSQTFLKLLNQSGIKQVRVCIKGDTKYVLNEEEVLIELTKEGADWEHLCEALAGDVQEVRLGYPSLNRLTLLIAKRLAEEAKERASKEIAGKVLKEVTEQKLQIACEAVKDPKEIKRRQDKEIEDLIIFIKQHKDTVQKIHSSNILEFFFKQKDYFTLAELKKVIETQESITELAGLDWDEFLTQ